MFGTSFTDRRGSTLIDFMNTPIGQPQMIKMGTKMVPAQTDIGNRQVQKAKKFLICLLYHNGDVDMAEQVASLITDIERVRVRDVDFLLVKRHDAREISTSVRAKLDSKFDQVRTHICRQRDGRGWPFGCNSMAYDLFALLGGDPAFRSDYYAFVLLEPDCVPTRPGWIGELIHEWKHADAEGFGAIGFIHNKPKRHLNGVAVYASDFARRVGGEKMRGGSAQIPWDVRHAESVLPLAKPSALIDFKWRRDTITPEELFATGAALYHGVKDRSALIAVRDRHINMKLPALVVPSALHDVLAAAIHPDKFAPPVETPPPPVETAKSTNVYTYFHKLTGTTIENQTILDLWRKGWATRGWNPIILTFADAVKNPKFPDFEEALAKLPCATDRKRWVHQFYRWLALDSKGGGLMVDYDVLPGDFTPTSIAENGVRVFRDHEASEMFGAYQNKGAIETWIKHILIYDAQPSDLLEDKPHVDDDDIMRAMHKPEAVPSNLTHFTGVVRGTDRKSVAMERFLSGK